MKFLLALDSYKNCLDSRSVSECVADGIHRVLPDAVTDILPVADGGEGSVRAVASGNPRAELRTEEVSGPLGRRHPAEYAWLEDCQTAFLELAGICGIELLPGNRLDVMHASTYGLGEMIGILYDKGIRRFTVAIGGSASCDGGLGMLQALGAVFTDARGCQIPPHAGPEKLPQIAACDLARTREIAGNISLRIFSDVTNPLLGPNGSAAVFGPQKGASPEDIPVLDQSLGHFYDILRSGIPELVCSCPGDGAAGGTGFALRGILNGETVSGAGAILKLADFQNRMKNADWIITGEGKSDAQTLQGKLPSVIAETARKYNKPVILLSGAVQDADPLLECFTAVLSIAQGPCSLKEAIASTKTNLTVSGQNIAAIVKTAARL